MDWIININGYKYNFIEVQDHPEEITIRVLKNDRWFWLGHIKLFEKLSHCCVLCNCFSDRFNKEVDKQHIKNIAEYLNFEPSEVNEEYDGLYINMYTSPEKFLVIKTYLILIGDYQC